MNIKSLIIPIFVFCQTAVPLAAMELRLQKVYEYNLNTAKLHLKSIETNPANNTYAYLDLILRLLAEPADQAVFPKIQAEACILTGDVYLKHCEKNCQSITQTTFSDPFLNDYHVRISIQNALTNIEQAKIHYAKGLNILNEANQTIKGIDRHYTALGIIISQEARLKKLYATNAMLHMRRKHECEALNSI